jgi:hypothetical protein
MDKGRRTFKLAPLDDYSGQALSFLAVILGHQSHDPTFA